MVKHWSELENLVGFAKWNVVSNGQSESHSHTVVLEGFRFWRWIHLDRASETTKATEAVCQEYLAYRMVTPARNKLRPPHSETIRSMRNRLKVLFDYLVMIGFVKVNPWLGIKGPRSETRYVEPPSDDQIDEILRSAGRTGRNPRMRARNRAIVYFLVHTGVRCNELVRLKREHVETEGGMIRTRAKVYGKGSKERLVGINEPARRTLSEYFKERVDTVDSAFVDGDGYPISNILVRSLMQRIKVEANKHLADKLKTLGTHDLRRWHFNKQAREGVPYNQIREIGGWKSDRAMKHYIYFGTVEVAAEKHSELILTRA